MLLLKIHRQLLQFKSLILLCTMCLLLGYSVQGLALSIVTHSSVTKTTMSVSELRAIFSMRLTHWSDSSPIKVFVLPNEHPRHKEFSKNVLRLFPHQLQSSWDRLVYSGTGSAPTVVQSEEEMRRVLAITPGSIGYISDRPEGGSEERVNDERLNDERLNVIKLP